jgi:hypothetical protein
MEDLQEFFKLIFTLVVLTIAYVFSAGLVGIWIGWVYSIARKVSG